MRQLDGSVRMGSGMIHAYGPHYRPQVVARKARAAVPEDTRPIHVRMREMHDQTGNWSAVAREFGFSQGQGAKTHVLAAERAVRR